MKRILIVVGLCALAVAAWGFDLSQITYLQAELPNSGPVVQIVSMKEFIQLVEAKHESFIYRIAAKTPRESFAFVADGAVFRVDALGFQNLADAEKAITLGVSDNAELQIEERFGVNNLDSTIYVNGEYFGSKQEYRTAMSGGFRGSSRGLQSLVLPKRMSAKVFHEFLLPQIAWYFLALDANQPDRFQVPQDSAAGAAAALPFAELAYIFENAGLQPRRGWSWIDYHEAVSRLDASPIFKRWATELLTMYSVNAAGDLVASTANPRDLDLMKAMAAIGVLPGSSMTTGNPATAGMAAAYGGGQQGTPPPGKVNSAEAMQIHPRFPSDSLVFAVARLSGMRRAADYLSLNEATVAGYRNVTDERAAVDGGFSRPRQYYSALRIGVTTVSNYDTVWSAGIRTSKMATRYLKLVADLRSLKSDYRTNGPNELAVAYVLTHLPASTPYAVMGILRRLRTIEKSFLLPQPHSMDLFSRAAHMVAGDQQPPLGGGYVTDLSEYSEIPRDSGIQELALELQHAPWISTLGNYDPVTSIFMRS